MVTGRCSEVPPPRGRGREWRATGSARASRRQLRPRDERQSSPREPGGSRSRSNAWRLRPAQAPVWQQRGRFRADEDFAGGRLVFHRHGVAPCRADRQEFEV